MPRNPGTQHSKSWFVLIMLCAARQLSAGFVCQAGSPQPPIIIPPPVGGLTTLSTNSATCSEQLQTTNLTQRVDQFTTELKARLQGGPLLLDRTFAAPFGDAVVQSALVSAQQLLAMQGAKGFIGPALLSTNTMLSGSNSVLTNLTQTAPPQSFIKTFNGIGPTSFQIGDLGQCQGLDAATQLPFGCDPNAGSTFTFPGGVIDFNTNTHTAYFLSVTNTTANTFLTSQVYELDGVTAPATGVPEPGTLALAGIAIPGLWLGLRLSRRRELDSNSQEGD